MAKFSKKNYDSVTEELDGNEYEGCSFTRCKLVYKGGNLPVLSNCQVTDSEWNFQDGADRTLLFLKGLYHGMGDGGKLLVENTFHSLRMPPGAAPR